MSAMCCRRISPGMHPERSAVSPGASLSPSRLDSGTTTPIRIVRGRRTSLGVMCGWAVGDGIDGFSDWLAVGVDGLQMGAEQFTGVGVNVLDLQPLGVYNLCRLAVLTRVVVAVVVVGVVVGEPAEEQVGEQVGAALLVGAWIMRRRGCGPWRRASHRWRRRLEPILRR